MKSTAEETKGREKFLDATLIRYVLYLFSPEEGMEQKQIRNTEQPLQWLRRHEGKIKTIFWYFLSVLLSMGISNFH